MIPLLKIGTSPKGKNLLPLREVPYGIVKLLAHYMFSFKCVPFFIRHALNCVMGATPMVINNQRLHQTNT